MKRNKLLYLIIGFVCGFSLLTATPYLCLDNQTLASLDEILDDPFLVLRTKSQDPQIPMDWQLSAQTWAQLETQDFSSSDHLPLSYLETEKTQSLVVVAPLYFEYTPPQFFIHSQGKETPQFLWWQISAESHFDSIYPNLNVQAPYTESIQLSVLEETFLNPGQTYYFRACTDQASWSLPHPFHVQKPASVQEVTFSKVDIQLYELSWPPDPSPSATYLIFASNALDFVPSIYCHEQYNVMYGTEVWEKETRYNWVGETSQTSILIDDCYAFYRIIAQDRNQLAVPSPLIYIYDETVVPVRTQLQQDALDPFLFTRQILPADYDYKCKNKAFFLLREKVARFLYNPLVSPTLWQELKPYFLPVNHPLKRRLDRLFGKKRVTQSEHTFEQAGFGKPKMRQPTNIVVGKSPQFTKYIFKVYLDTQPCVCEWDNWVKRIEGSCAIRACIKRHGFKNFSVPHKWIYPLPEEPSPPCSPSYQRKNFILIAEDMNILPSKDNLKAFRTKMTSQLLKELYTILTEEGLIDSVYPDNIPFTKSKQIAFIDTEHHHRAPIPYHKLTRFLSNEMQNHWISLID